ncbi:MAG: hypothetical protein RIG63_24295 [Coleofasciculus chthonoplastes F3-SA18-01]|uniref:hypothetical protein n=1 Tax=Coleofasciculus chthonoplastes TaxID=64178 RepID=UPI0032FA511D
MVSAIELIEQDLAKMEGAIAHLASQLHDSYATYLTVLGQTVQKQLMLAGYQVCTQGYPDAFLSLSFNQRQNLQQALRQIGKEGRDELILHLQLPQDLSSTLDDELDDEDEELELLVEFTESLAETTTNPSPDSALTPQKPILPDQLLQWQDMLEDQIALTLQTVSVETNHLLQQEGIIPDKLPPTVLEAATKADAAGESSPGSNLLNLLVETQTPEDDDDSTLTRIIAVNLRLSEIEFTEPQLVKVRNQIRNLLAHTTKFQRQYRKKQREWTVVQAEAAWRASWFED